MDQKRAKLNAYNNKITTNNNNNNNNNNNTHNIKYTGDEMITTLKIE
jgi:hypothetical protein